MEMNHCRACSGFISHKANVCCHCGKKDPRGRRRMVVMVIFGLFMVAGLFLLMESTG
ncbi:hypothetical protein [Vibrio sinensis]|uniref:hypothetical protein n=1 Tax=Vibrio sinensis TaxID=2302434 RepID=UPI0014023177|nr:hypothetical protein [Vibrio sinensis]